MLSEANFTAEEWEQIRAAPLYVATYVLTASTAGPPGLPRELFALHGAADELRQGASAPAVGACLLAESVGEARSGAPSSERARLLAQVKTAVALIDLKAGDDAAALKRWAYSVGEQMARATKGGGFLGLGGKLVSAEEQAALSELSKLMA